MRRQTILWGIVGILLGTILPVYGADRKVPSQYPTIQAGIDAAQSGDTVLVADGTYTGTGNRDIDFKHKAITVKSQSGAEKCIIDCQGNKDNRHRGFYFHSSEDNRSTLDGFTVRGGYSNDGGGGIKCDNASPTIMNCIIRNNMDSAQNLGCGIYCTNGSSAKIAGCSVKDNLPSDDLPGHSTGGIGCDGNSSPTIQNCQISGNPGGLAFASCKTVVVTGCTITGNGEQCVGNAVYSAGGGVCGSRGSITIRDCNISKNEAVN